MFRREGVQGQGWPALLYAGPLYPFIGPDETADRHRLDRRACYALPTGAAVLFRRVEYDIQATMQKIAGVPDLAGSLATHLKAGR